jgi:hypothetical protein
MLFYSNIFLGKYIRIKQYIIYHNILYVNAKIYTIE